MREVIASPRRDGGDVNHRAKIAGSIVAAISVLPAGLAQAEPSAAFVIEIRDYASLPRTPEERAILQEALGRPSGAPRPTQ